MLFACFPSSEIYLLSFVVCMLSQNKNMFNNFLITAPRRTRTLFLQKFSSLTSALEYGNALVLHSPCRSHYESEL